MLHVLFQEVDESRNGQISFSEFLAFCKKTKLFDTADKASEVFFSKRSVPTASEILFSDHDIFRLSSSEALAARRGKQHHEVWGVPAADARCRCRGMELRRAFAATLADGAVVTWGGGCQGGDSGAVCLQLRDVQQIQASEHAFAAILNDGSVVTWGSSSHGSDSSAVQDQLKNVQQIQATRTAFAAIRGDGAVVTWGNLDHGGDSSAVQDRLKNVKQVQASDQTFAAILGDGSVVTWGGRSDDLCCNAAQHRLKNVQQISATGSAFAAILGDGSVVT
eukprot:s82_g16.t1